MAPPQARVSRRSRFRIGRVQADAMPAVISSDEMAAAGWIGFRDIDSPAPLSCLASRELTASN